MRKILCLLAALLILSGCSGRTDWVTFRGEQGRGTTSTSVTPPIAVKWKLRLQVDEQNARSFNPPVVLDDTIYFGSNDGNFYALDIESGFMRWVFQTDRPINSVPYADKDYVYFGSNDGNVYAVTRDEGKQVWSFDTEHTVQSTVTKYEDLVVFTSDVGATYFVNAEGVEEHRIPNPVWLYHTFQMYKDVMYFAPGPESTPLSFGAFDLNQKAYVWVIDTAGDGARWYSFPALKGSKLYYSTCGFSYEGYFNYSYLALDRETGQILWRSFDESDFGGRVGIPLGRLFEDNLELLDYMAPAIWKNLVIYTSGDAVVRAFEANSGGIAWKRKFPYPTSSAPTIAGGRVYFGLRGDEVSGDLPEGYEGENKPKLVCLSARDGRLLWEIDIDGAVLSAPVVAGKWVIFGTSRNFFYVLEQIY